MTFAIGRRDRAKTSERMQRLARVGSATRPLERDRVSNEERRVASLETLATASLFIVVVLSLVGSVMVLSASSVAAGSPFEVFSRQVMWIGLGFVVLAFTARVDYRTWGDHAFELVAVATALLIAVLVPGIGREVNGAQRWIGAGAFQIQPSEPAKLALVVFLAAMLAANKDKIRHGSTVLRATIVVAGGFGLLVMLEPNLGTTIVLGAITGTMLFWAGLPGRHLAGISAVGVSLAAFLALAEPYRRARVTAFLDPWADAGDTGYQTIQSLIGVASGGVSGTGLGESRAKWGFLPEAHTDFVFSIISEELGLIGSLFIVGLFAALVFCGLGIATRARDDLGTLLAVGITAWIAVQAFVNIGAVIGILPITGVPLPYVSFGGSSLVTTMAAAGILRNIARSSATPTPQPAQRVGQRA